MKLKEFLEANKFINKSQLAADIWPGVKYPSTKLANKLSNTAGQRVTKKDIEKINKWIEQKVGTMTYVIIVPD